MNIKNIFLKVEPKYGFSFINKFLKRMEVQVIGGMVLGTFFALYFPEYVVNIEWMGDIFINMLKVFLGPLLFFSILIAILGLGDLNKLGTIGSRTVIYYMLTTALAILLSLFLLNVFQPGSGITFKEFNEFNSAGVEALTFSSFVLSLIPGNIFEAFVNLNAMQIVTMSVIIGIFILKSGVKSEIKEFNSIIDTINNGILSFIEFVVKLTPFGVFAIIAGVVSQNGIDSIMNLFPLVSVIIFGLALHALITLPIVGLIVGKFDPFVYLRQIKDAIILGFSTSSSSATMGLSMQVAKNNAKLSDEVVGFTIPLGTTINMNGTALYQAGATLFIAQVLGIDLNFMQQFTMVIIVILASVGAAGIPGAGILILTTVFISLGLPIEAIALLLAVDRILDMFRTGVNVWGDLLTAKVIDRFYKMDVLDKSERKKKFSSDELEPDIT